MIRAAALVLAFVATAVQAQDFPASLTIVVGFAPGGGDDASASAGRSAAARLQPQPGYDQTARLYARHLGKFLPGAPSVGLRHMPGAGSARAADYLAREAPRDGAVLAVVSGEALIAPEITE